MIIVILFSLIFIGIIIYKFNNVLWYYPASPIGYKKLKEEIEKQGFTYHGNHYLITTIFFVFGLSFLGLLFELKFVFIVIYIVISLLFVPFITLWHYQYLKQEVNFNNLVIYLQHFIASFKINPKTYVVLSECQNLFDDSTNNLLQESLEIVKQGEDVEKGLAKLNKLFPHFITFNLHILVSLIERYGSYEYYDSLEMLQNDTDDLIEDVELYKVNQKQLKFKVNILILFALVLALMVKLMLASIALETSGDIYQASIFIFLNLILVTYVMGQKIDSHKFINQGEVIC